MQRTKQQALMFLLGAVLVGGVLGFSAERVLGSDEHRRDSSYRRDAMYDDLGLSAAQRAAMDSVLDERNCRLRALMNSVRPQADSIRAAGRTGMLAIMTPEQRTRFDQRRAELEAREKQDHAQRDQQRKKRPTETCR